MRPNLSRQAFDHRGDRLAVGDVALMRMRSPCRRRRRLLDRLAHAVEIAVDRENLRAFLREAHGAGAAIAPARADAAGAGDDRDFAVQPIAHASASPLANVRSLALIVQDAFDAPATE